MSRAIFVLGTGRDGSSATAGVLDHLGCTMGKEFHPSDRRNPYGTFEDVEFLYPENKYIRGQGPLPDYEALLAARNEAHKIWGAKSPLFVHTARHFLPLQEDARLVILNRKPADVINSYMRAYSHGRVTADTWYANQMDSLSARLREFDGPVLQVSFEDLLDDPESEVRRIMHFAFEGMELPDNQAFNAAVRHIRQKPKKPVKGWGDIAIGVRVGKHPDAMFFSSWTKLLTGGVRSGDTVLEPAMYMPAHKAATKLARTFLSGDKDSLMLIDDDMSFSGQDLFRLRENQANWEYDIVAAFATHKVWPPKPVVLLHTGDLGMPKSIDGDSFNTKMSIQKGDIVEVDAVGLAFTLIRREVLEAMVDETWGMDHTYFFAYGKGIESDDIQFCRNARKLGFRMAVDSGVCIYHVGPKAYGWEDFEEWRSDLSPIEMAQAESADTEPKGLMDLSSVTLKPILERAAESDDKIGMSAQAILEHINAFESKE